MSIWLTQTTIQALNRFSASSLVEQLGIEFTEIGEDYLTATMPVDRRTVQPAHYLHGGASAALAETLASTAGNLCVDLNRKVCFGLEINANHVRSVDSGLVTGTARPLHLGSTTQVWDIRIHDEQERLVCVSRLTLAVLDRAGSKEINDGR